MGKGRFASLGGGGLEEMIRSAGVLLAPARRLHSLFLYILNCLVLNYSNLSWAIAPTVPWVACK